MPVLTLVLPQRLIIRHQPQLCVGQSRRLRLFVSEESGAVGTVSVGPAALSKENA